MTRYLLALVSLLFLIACHKDSDEVITIIDQPDPPEVLITTRIVSVFDLSGSGVNPTEIAVAGQTLPILSHPFAQLKSAGLDRDFELMEIHTTSNLDFLQVQSLVENDVNYAHISFPVLTVFTGMSNIREDFSFLDYIRITVPSMSILTMDSMVYEGTYMLHVGHVDSTSYGIPVPGYIGQTVHHENKILLFNSCYYVSVTTQDGQPLILSDAATLACPGISGEKWAFNAEKAIWYNHENPAATDPQRISLGNEKYYAFADFEEASRTTGTLQINGQPTPNYPIRFIYDGGEQIIYTTNSGRWALYLPAGQTCTAIVWLPCGEKEEITFTTSETDESVAHLNVESTEIINARITGTSRDCNFLPLDLNYTALKCSWWNSLVLSDDPQLNFHIPIPLCGEFPLFISSIDPLSGEQGPFIPWKAKDTIQIYSTLACEKANDEYLSLSVSDEQKIYWELASQSDGDRLIIANDMTDPDLDFQVFIEGMNEGAYTDQMLNIIFEDKALGTRGYSLYCPTAPSGCGFKNFTITHFAETEGQWIRGVFEGKFWIKTFHPLTAGYRNVKGEFQVFREF